METKKVLSLIFSIIFVCAFGFVLSWGIINFNKVKDGMSGTELYTKEDLNNAYNDGYDTALKDKDEYTELINGYRDTITTLNDNISQLNSQINILTNNNKDYKNQVTNLESQKSNLQSQVNNLTTIKSNNEETITQLNSQITTLQKEVAELEKDNENKDTTIEQKNSQIASLQATVSQLQRTNELNNDTITSLNNQIASLNSQISDMTMQIQNNSSNVTALNNKIAELEKSVSYYEQYIANLENGEQVVATFEFDGSVYNIQVVNKNSTVSVVNPTSTDYLIFNYWTVGGERIDLSTYQITTNTKIVANVTYKYDVKFMVDDTVYNSQFVVKNGYATIPTNPIKGGYEFDGWTTNGVDIISNINTTMVTQNTTYVAKFTKLHTVTFMYEDTIKEIQTVRNGEYPTNISVDNTEYKIFNGWKLNDTIVDITSQKIVADTTFVADITYKYDVKFMVDDTEYDSQIVVENGYATVPTNPLKTNYNFDGWSTNGSDIINVNTFVITNNTKFIAVFNQKYGLFDSETKAITKSWDELIADGDIKIEETNAYKSIKCSNTSLAGDLVVPNVDGITSICGMFDDCSLLTSIDLSNFDTSKVKDLSYMFNGCENLLSLDLSSFDTSKVKDLSYMFNGCENLLSIDLSNFDTSNVTTMYRMFYGCSVLRSLDLSNFDTSKVENMGFMFGFCFDLLSLDLSNFNTSKVDNMANMFSYCCSLTSLDLSSFYTSKVIIMYEMFTDCTSLTTLDLSNFDTRNVIYSNSMYSRCRSLTNVIVGENYTLDNLPV